jgi:hypothetical protein
MVMAGADESFYSAPPMKITFKFWDFFKIFHWGTPEDRNLYLYFYFLVV